MKKNPEKYCRIHGKFIDAQIRLKNQFFQSAFKGKDFKTQARKYLRARGLLK